MMAYNVNDSKLESELFKVLATNEKKNGYDRTRSFQNYANDNDDKLVSFLGGKFTGGVWRAQYEANKDDIKDVGDDALDQDNVANTYATMSKRTDVQVAKAKFYDILEAGGTKEEAWTAATSHVVQRNHMMDYNMDDSNIAKGLFITGATQYMATDKDGHLGFADVSIEAIKQMKSNNIDDVAAITQNENFMKSKKLYKTDDYKTMDTLSYMDVNMETVWQGSLITDMAWEFFDQFTGEERMLRKDAALQTKYENLNSDTWASVASIGLAVGEGIALASISGGAGGAAVAGNVAKVGKTASLIAKLAKNTKLMRATTQMAQIGLRGFFQDTNDNDGLAEQYSIGSGNVNKMLMSRGFDLLTGFVSAKYTGRWADDAAGVVTSSIRNKAIQGGKNMTIEAAKKAIASSHIYGTAVATGLDLSIDLAMDIGLHKAVKSQWGDRFTTGQDLQLDALANFSDALKDPKSYIGTLLQAASMRASARMFGGVLGRTTMAKDQESMTKSEVVGSAAYAAANLGNNWATKSGARLATVAANLMGGSGLVEYNDYLRRNQGLFSKSDATVNPIENYFQSKEFKTKTFLKSWLLMNRVKNLYISEKFDDNGDLKNGMVVDRSAEIKHTKVIAAFLSGIEGRYLLDNKLEDRETAIKVVTDYFKEVTDNIAEQKKAKLNKTPNAMSPKDIEDMEAETKRKLSWLYESLSNTPKPMIIQSVGRAMKHVFDTMSTGNDKLDAPMIGVKKMLTDFTDVTDADDPKVSESIILTPAERKKYAKEFNQAYDASGVNKVVDFSTPENVETIKAIATSDRVGDALAGLIKIHNQELIKGASETRMSDIITDLESLIKRANNDDVQDMMSDMVSLNGHMGKLLLEVVEAEVNKLNMYVDNPALLESTRPKLIIGTIQKIATLASIAPVAVGDKIATLMKNIKDTSKMDEIFRKYEDKQTIAALDDVFTRLDSDDILGHYLSTLATNGYNQRIKAGKLSMMLFGANNKEAINYDDYMVTMNVGGKTDVYANHALYASRFNAGTLGSSDFKVGTIDDPSSGVSYRTTVDGKEYVMKDRGDQGINYFNIQKFINKQAKVHDSVISKHSSNSLTQDETISMISAIIQKLTDYHLNTKYVEGDDINAFRDRVRKAVLNDIEKADLSDMFDGTVSIDGNIFGTVFNAHSKGIKVTRDAAMPDYDISYDIKKIATTADDGTDATIKENSESLWHLATRAYSSTTNVAGNYDIDYDTQIAIGTNVFRIGENYYNDVKEVVTFLDKEMGFGNDIQSKVAMVVKGLDREDAIKSTMGLIKIYNPKAAEEMGTQLRNISTSLVNQAVIRKNAKFSIGMHRNERLTGTSISSTDDILDINSSEYIRGFGVIASVDDETTDIGELYNNLERQRSNGVIVMTQGGAGWAAQIVSLPKEYFTNTKEGNTKFNKHMLVALVNSLAQKNGVSGPNDDVLKWLLKDKSDTNITKDSFVFSDIDEAVYSNLKDSKTIESKIGEFSSYIMKGLIDRKLPQYAVNIKGVNGKNVKSLEINQALADTRKINKLELAIANLEDLINDTTITDPEVIKYISEYKVLSKEQLDLISEITAKFDNPTDDPALNNADLIAKAKKRARALEVKADINLLQTKFIREMNDKIAKRLKIDDTEETYNYISKMRNLVNAMSENYGVVDPGDIDDNVSSTTKHFNGLFESATTAMNTKRKEVDIKHDKDWERNSLSTLMSYIVYGDHVIRAKAPFKRTGTGSKTGLKFSQLSSDFRQVIAKNVAKTRIVVFDPLNNKAGNKQVADGAFLAPTWLLDYWKAYGGGQGGKMTLNTGLGLMKIMAHGNGDLVGTTIKNEAGNDIVIELNDIVISTTTIKDMSPEFIKQFGIMSDTQVKSGQGLVSDTMTDDKRTWLVAIAKRNGLNGTDAELVIQAEELLKKDFISSIVTHANLTSDVNESNLSIQAANTDYQWDLIYSNKVKQGIVNYAITLDKLNSTELYSDPNGWYKSMQSIVRRTAKVMGGGYKIAAMSALKTSLGDIELIDSNEFTTGKFKDVQYAHIGHSMLYKKLATYYTENKKLLSKEHKKAIKRLLDAHIDIFNAKGDKKQIGNNTNGTELVNKTLEFLAMEESNGNKLQTALVKDTVNGQDVFYANFTRFPAQRSGQQAMFAIKGIKREAMSVDLQLEAWYTEQMQNTDYDGDKAVWIGISTEEFKESIYGYLDNMVVQGTLSDEDRNVKTGITEFIRLKSKRDQSKHIGFGYNQYAVKAPMSAPKLAANVTKTRMAVGMGIKPLDTMRYLNILNRSSRKVAVSKYVKNKYSELMYTKSLKRSIAEGLNPDVDDNFVFNEIHVNGDHNTFCYIDNGSNGKRESKSLGSSLITIPSVKFFYDVDDTGHKIKKKVMVEYLDAGEDENGERLVRPVITIVRGDDNNFGQHDFGVLVDKHFTLDPVKFNSGIYTASTLGYLADTLTSSFNMWTKNGDKTLTSRDVSDTLNSLRIGSEKIHGFSNTTVREESVGDTGVRIINTIMLEEQGQNSGVNQATTGGSIYLDWKYSSRQTLDSIGDELEYRASSISSATNNLLLQIEAGSRVKISDFSKNGMEYSIFNIKGKHNKSAESLAEFNRSHGSEVVQDIVIELKKDNGLGMSLNDYNQLLTFHSKKGRTETQLTQLLTLGFKYRHLLDGESTKHLDGKMLQILSSINSIMNDDGIPLFDKAVLDKTISKTDLYQFIGKDGRQAMMKTIETDQSKVKEGDPPRTTLAIFAAMKISHGFNAIRNVFGGVMGKILPHRALTVYNNLIDQPVSIGGLKNLGDLDATERMISDITLHLQHSGVSLSNKQIGEMFNSLGLSISMKTHGDYYTAIERAVIESDPANPDEYRTMAKQFIDELPEITEHVLVDKSGKAVSIDGLVVKFNKYIDELKFDKNNANDLAIEKRKAVFEALAGAVSDRQQEAMYIRANGYDKSFILHMGADISESSDTADIRLSYDNVSKIAATSKLFNGNRTDVSLDTFSSRVVKSMKTIGTNCN